MLVKAGIRVEEGANPKIMISQLIPFARSRAWSAGSESSRPPRRPGRA